MEIKLKQAWKRGHSIASGGFGKVYAAEGPDGTEAVIKLVPKAVGADRELLFVDLGGARNIVPIIDNGEWRNSWALVMPRASESLRDRISSHGSLDVDDAILVIEDVATALVDLGGKVVHRDLKPENILFLDGRWCLADFGISRYAEATTAPDTHKFSMTFPYAAPEQWRNQRATTATDIYALGITAFEMIAGRRPYPGPTQTDWREQHLHADPPGIPTVPPALAALIDECLYKAPEGRPSPANLLARLEKLSAASGSAGLAALEEANRRQVARNAEQARSESQAQSAAEQYDDLYSTAHRSLGNLSQAMVTALRGAAPSAAWSEQDELGWQMSLSRVMMTMSRIRRSGAWPEHYEPAFEVIAVSSLGISFPQNSHGYKGRSHSLWFCDAVEPGQFTWYETAFMISPLVRRISMTDPFALSPGLEAGKALSRAVAEYQVAWPFTELRSDQVDELISRWGGWFAAASQGTLGRPNTMPERSPDGSWRYE